MATGKKFGGFTELAVTPAAGDVLVIKDIDDLSHGLGGTTKYVTRANLVGGLIGAVIYQGVWNASTNVPALATGAGTKGFYYKVSVDGATNLDGIVDWKVNDWVIYNGTAWEKVDNTEAALLKTGLDLKLVTGTEGGNGNLAVWNVDGDLVGGPANAAADWNTAFNWNNHANAGYLNALAQDAAPQLTATLDTNGFAIGDTMGGIVSFEAPIDAQTHGASANGFTHNGSPTQDRLLYWDASNNLTPSSVDPATLITASSAETLTNKTIIATINAQTLAAYTLVLTDNVVTMSNAGANVITVPPNSSVAFPVGTQITGIWKGVGETSFAAGVGVTINSEASERKLNAQFAAATLVKEATDTWYLIGSLKA